MRWLEIQLPIQQNRDLLAYLLLSLSDFEEEQIYFSRKPKHETEKSRFLVRFTDYYPNYDRLFVPFQNSEEPKFDSSTAFPDLRYP